MRARRRRKQGCRMSRLNDTVPLITDKERVRRLVALPDVRSERLARLRSARVAIVGVGGLGNAAAQYLAAQGIAHLTLIDGDTVDGGNLGRQILFGPEDVGHLKVEAAAHSLRRLAPDLQIRSVPLFLTAENGPSLVDSHDLILDGLDTAPPRQWLNRWAIAHKVPVIFAGAVGYEAQVFPVYGQAPCLSCLWPSFEGPELDCATSGILGPLVGMVGALQAALAIKHVIGLEKRAGILWTFDLFQARARTIALTPNPQCPVCGVSREEMHDSERSL